MNQNNLSFESENLRVDYLSFKFQELDHSTKMKIANYLFKLRFNSYQEAGKLSKPIKECILVSPKNQFESFFVTDNPYWEGTLLHISGKNASRFYFLAKQKVIDWTVFEEGLLCRLDLHYSRQNKTTDKISSQQFLQESLNQLKQKNKNLRLEKNRKGWILKIGNRRSNNYSRIYQGEDFLRFEHEMKGRLLRKYHLLLVDNRFQEFEQKLSSYFTVYFGKLFPLQYSYLDWLVRKLRPLRKQTNFQLGLNSDYIHSEIKMDTRDFLSLIRFLNYAKDLDFKLDSLGDVTYRKVVFRVRDFIEFQDPGVKRTNQYRLTKTKEFFKQLQTGLHVTAFSDTYFQSLVLVPQVQFEKCSKQKFLIAKVWLVDKLFYYNYPFYLPNFFQSNLTKHQLEVQVQFIQTFSTISTEKIFYIQEFFQNYKSTLTNKTKTKMKAYCIQIVQGLQDSNLIENNFRIISKGSFHSTQKLTIKNISEGFVIYEKISLPD